MSAIAGMNLTPARRIGWLGERREVRMSDFSLGSAVGDRLDSSILSLSSICLVQLTAVARPAR